MTFIKDDEYGALQVTHESRETNARFDVITIGIVKNNNDPDQMGRLQIHCPTLGDDDDNTFGFLPWALCIIPGQGTWDIPEVGKSVAVMCLDGHPMNRVYFGEVITDREKIANQPHGRYIPIDGEGPHGPYNEHGNPLPSFDNTQESYRKDVPSYPQPFGCNETEQAEHDHPHDEEKPDRQNPEVSQNQNAPALGEGGSKSDEVDSKVPKTPTVGFKAAEYVSRSVFPAVSAMTPEMAKLAEGSLLAPVPDVPGYGDFYPVKDVIDYFRESAAGVAVADASTDEVTTYPLEDQPGTKKHRTGYVENTKVAPMDFNYTKKRFAPLITSIVRGGHGFSMNEDVQNSQMVMRSNNGAKILIDDTGERMYMATAKGKTWVEMDEAGMVDIYGAKSVSIASDSDINIYSKKSVRISADEGVHILSEGGVRVQAKTELHLKSKGSTFIDSQADVNLVAVNSIVGSAEGMISFNAGKGGYFQSGCALNLRSGGPVYMTGSEAHINSTPAAKAPSALSASDAWTVNRAPEKEPWARHHADKSAAEGDGSGQHGTDQPVDGASTKRVKRREGASITLDDQGRDTENGANRYVAPDYDDDSIGRVDENGKEIPRNIYWRR